jgi:hypothetical protein
MSLTASRYPPGGRVRLGLLLLVLAVFPATAEAHGYGARNPSQNHGSPSHHLGYSGHPSGPPRHQPEPDPLSAGPLIATVDQYGSAPNHYSGTPADWSELNVIAGRFRADGLQLGSIAYHFPRFQPTNVALSADAKHVSSWALAPLLYSGTTSRAGIKAPLLDAASGSFTPAQAAGRIVVVSQLAGGVLDSSITAAIAAGAKGLVYVTQGVGDLPVKQDVNSRKGTGDFPVLLIGKQSGAKIVADAEAGQSADLTLQARLGTATDYDVWGVLPGTDRSRRVFVGTPASSMTPAASERGGGIAILLGLARHYAVEPLSQRPETLVFLATTGHEVGFLGLEALMRPRAAGSPMLMPTSTWAPRSARRPGSKTRMARSP